MLPVDKLEVYSSEKIIALEDASFLVSQLKNSGKTVGLCHGCFDLLHPGHVKHLESAKKLCDVLVVSITGDKFIGSRKGSERPIFTDKLRAYMLANLESVDYVVILDYPKATEVLEIVKPSFYIRGVDIINLINPAIVEEREIVEKIGGKTLYTNDPKLSTTEIVDHISSLDN